MSHSAKHTSSFRDPSGYVFIENGVVKRRILPIYFKQYKSLGVSFYQKLFRSGHLIPHVELVNNETEIIIQPEPIPFITYPYEWSFNQYKAAALLTLKLHNFSLKHNFILKDASAFNITLHKGSPIFIDTLSFDFYVENQPWRAYKQFVMHFLGPLVLAYYNGAQSLKFMSSFIDGVPLRMLSKMLPYKTKLHPFLYANIHLLAKFENKHNEDYKGSKRMATLSKKGQLKMVESLYDFIQNLTLKEHTEWGNYYDKINYSDLAFQQKSTIVNHWIAKINAKTLIDIGGNDGTFVRKISTELTTALVCDIDATSIDLNFNAIKEGKESHITPFVLDVLNPSAGIGFQNSERFSFIDRIVKFAPDVTLALAVIHHITLSGNVPFERSAEFFASFSKYLIIEFPDRSDSWVQRLLSTKMEFQTHFEGYNLENFEFSYLKTFDLIEKINISHSNRVMCFFKKR